MPPIVFRYELFLRIPFLSISLFLSYFLQSLLFLHLLSLILFLFLLLFFYLSLYFTLSLCLNLPLTLFLVCALFAFTFNKKANVTLATINTHLIIKNDQMHIHRRRKIIYFDTYIFLH